MRDSLQVPEVPQDVVTIGLRQESHHIMYIPQVIGCPGPVEHLQKPPQRLSALLVGMRHCASLQR